MAFGSAASIRFRLSTQRIGWAMPSEVLIPGADQGREPTVEDLKRELGEAHRREAATAEILKVISRSDFDLQPVLDTLVESAARLCEADSAAIHRRVGDDYPFAASYGLPPEFVEFMHGRPFAPGQESAFARAVLNATTVHIPDVQAEHTDSEVVRRWRKIGGYRTTLAIPLLRDGSVIGTIVVTRNVVRPFTDKQIELVTTFADQAVIAIENTRLFEAEQTSKRELQESLEYQTAISDVLNVISRSPTDVQPVFETIAKSAASLCRARFCHVFRFDGELVHFVASQGLTPEAAEMLRDAYPMRPGRASISARAILSGAVEEIPEVDADPEYQHAPIARALGYGSVVATPMLKDARPIGAVVVGRSEIGKFPERQIDLLRTFADQAVIAIENTRLFEAEQASKRELEESLQQQTATADVLKVISRSTFDLQGVLDALVESASRLCGAVDVSISRLEGDRLLRAAHFGPILNPVGYVTPAVRSTVAGLCVLERRPVHVADLQAEKETYPEGSAIAREFGHRTTLAVPLLREGAPLGAMALRRAKVEPFTHKQIELVTTFADQAVIAIENTRLFEAEQASKRELQESLE